MIITRTYAVCRTGKTEQFFTLYIQQTLQNGCFFKESCYFVQNLAHNKDEAIAKVTEMMNTAKRNNLNNDYSQDMDFFNSKQKEYCDLSAFGLKWTKSKKGFYVRLDYLPKDDVQGVWAAWRKDKDLLKEAGFSVFMGKNEGEWFFFFKNCSDDEMNTKLGVLKIQKAEKVVKGNFIGALKDRFTTQVTLAGLKHTVGMYGSVQVMTFKTKTGNVLTSFYSGKKQAPEVGTTLSLTGTIKCHKEYNGVNQTILTRINF